MLGDNRAWTPEVLGSVRFLSDTSFALELLLLHRVLGSPHAGQGPRSTCAVSTHRLGHPEMLSADAGSQGSPENSPHIPGANTEDHPKGKEPAYGSPRERSASRC